MRLQFKLVKKLNNRILKTLLEISKNDDSGVPVSERWLKEIGRHDVFFIVLVDVEHSKRLPIGFAAIDPWFKYDKNGIELDIITVKKEFQKKGIGTKLIEAVENYAKRINKKIIYLMVNSLNTRARMFYAKLGFEVAGILTDRYGLGKHSIFMRKKIKN